MKKCICITFDVEEFDMPLEYNQQINIEEQMQVGFNGLNAIKPLIQDIECTLFTTAHFAETFPIDIASLSNQHEIASHTYYHSNFENKDLLLSKQKLELIIGKKVQGLRMPRMRKIEMSEVKLAGYEYDSSINPCFLPGKYNNTHLPKIVYNDMGMNRVPATVTPNFRIPLFWLAFKNMPYFLFKKLALQSLNTYGFLNLYFHPWEFVDLRKYDIPFYAKTGSHSFLLNRLGQLIKDMKNEGELVSISTYLKHQ